MRRILIFSLVYHPRFVGGAEIAVKEITDRIPGDEFEFDMICLNGGGEKKVERIGNITVHRLSGGVNFITKIFFPLFAFLKARMLHRAKPYDAVWSIMASYAGFAAMLFKKSNQNIPFILTIQEGDNFNRRQGIFRPFFRMIFSAADRIQVISHFLENWARDMGATCPIMVVPNAVNYELFSRKPGDAETAAVEKEIGKKEGDVFLITTSRLVPKNAVKDIIEALKYISQPVKLLILGQGREEKSLRALSSRLKLSDRVRFIGSVPHAELPKYLHVSDIFVRPSLSEGFGNSFVEAMATGIPVIATPVGGITDFLVDGETGLFCEVGNPRSIAQKVGKLMKDRESREYIVKNARNMVKEKYQWNTVAEKMKDILLG